MGTYVAAVPGWRVVVKLKDGAEQSFPIAAWCEDGPDVLVPMVAGSGKLAGCLTTAANAFPGATVRIQPPGT
jgi:hypothetical protein